MEASPTPTIAATNITDQLTAQVTELTQRLDELATGRCQKPSTPPGRSPSPAPRQRQRQPTPADSTTEAEQFCWYHIEHSEMLPRNVNLLVRSRETPRPVTSGDERSWLTNKSPAIFYRCELCMAADSSLTLVLK